MSLFESYLLSDDYLKTKCYQTKRIVFHCFLEKESV
jgi:hypothetical protein